MEARSLMCLIVSHFKNFEYTSNTSNTLANVQEIIIYLFIIYRSGCWFMGFPHPQEHAKGHDFFLLFLYKEKDNSQMFS